MTTIYKLAEQVLKLYGQKVVGSKVTRQEAILAVGQSTNKIVRELIWRNKSEDNYTIPYVCFREFRLGVKLDTVRNKWYATLPIRTLESVAYNQGIYHVAPIENIDDTMIPVSIGFNSMTRGLDAFNLENRLSYYPERDRIYIQGTEFNSSYEIFVRVIPDTTALEADEDIPCPSDLHYEIQQLALQLLGVQMSVPEDTQTDGL
jgi:hypothetical protein